MKRSKIAMLLSGLLLSSCSTQIKEVSANEPEIRPSDYQEVTLQNMEHLNAHGIHVVKEKCKALIQPRWTSKNRQKKLFYGTG